MRKKKKNTPSTFVLNVNDVSYFFVEGKAGSLGPMYCVYYDNSKEGPVNFSAANFIDIHGLHDKETLVNFTKRALLKLTTLQTTDEKAARIYKVFYDVHYKALNSDKKKPKLGKLKKKFIDALAEYNEIMELLPGKLEISYDEDYEVVNKKEKTASIKNVKRYIPTNERKVVKKIVNEYEDTKGVQRKLKYD